MCNEYPNCQHAGPLVPKRDGMDRHCETVLPNHDCPYLMLGCYGCTFNHKGPIKPIFGIAGSIAPSLPPVDWGAEVEKLRAQTIEINVPIVKMNEDALLAIVADAWRSYMALQGLVAAGVVTPEWASKSLRNVIQYTYRQAIARIIAAYVLTRS